MQETLYTCTLHLRLYFEVEFKSSPQGYIKSILFENDHSSNCLIFPYKRSISYKELRKHMKSIEN